MKTFFKCLWSVFVLGLLVFSTIIGTILYAGSPLSLTIGMSIMLGFVVGAVYVLIMQLWS